MQQRSEETRARLLDAALKRFANDGFNAASVDAICSQAGVSKGAFYHHFSSKQAVFIALLEGWLQTIESGLQAARQEDIPDTFLGMTSIIPSVLTTADDRLPLFLEFWLQASRDETFWNASIAPYRRFQDFFASLVEDGIRQGSFQAIDTQVAGRTILAVAIGLFLQGLLDPHSADWSRVGRESMQILMRGLST